MAIRRVSDISSWRLASPRAENKSSLTLVSAERFFSSVQFLSCIAANAFISISVPGCAESRLRTSASNMRNSCSHLRPCCSANCLASSVVFSSRRSCLRSSSISCLRCLHCALHSGRAAFSSAILRAFFSLFNCASNDCFWRRSSAKRRSIVCSCSISACRPFVSSCMRFSSSSHSFCLACKQDFVVKFDSSF